MTTAEIKNIAELFAFVAAGGFFLFKWITGYFIVNLSTSLETTRHRGADNNDLLLITVFLEKGERGSFYIYEAGVLIQGLPDGDRQFLLPETHRYAYKPGRKIGLFRSRHINYRERHSRRPFIRLTPSMKTQYACHVCVPSSAVCRVEVTVIGRKTGSPFVAQFKASAVSPPLGFKGDGGGKGDSHQNCGV